MFTSDNQTLHSLSWLIRNRFIAVIAVYGILSPLQSVGSMESIWSTFAVGRILDFIDFTSVCCAFIFCSFNCYVNLDVL